MPYIYKEILEDGDIAADVVEVDIVDSIADERDSAIAERDSVIAERDSLISQLDSAKKKFADSFINASQVLHPNSPAKKDESVEREVSYKSLFDWRE